MKLLVAAVLLLPPQDARSPVPPEAAQKAAERIAKDIFKEDYAKKTPAGRSALAAKLLQQAMEASGDEATTFVLLREAKDLGALAVDVNLTFRAIAQLGKLFQVDEAAMKLDALTSAAKSAREPEQSAALGKACLQLAEEAARAEAFELAEQAVDVGVAQARKGKDFPTISKLETKRKEVAEIRSRVLKIRKAAETLEKKPDDPEANLVVGRHLVLSKGDWEVGLPRLAKGADAGLKAAAAGDLAGPSTPPEQVAAGDAWWNLGEKDAPAARGKWRARAAHWYLKARDRLSGLQRALIDKRIEEAAVASGPASVDLLKLVDPGKDGVVGAWTIADGKLVSPRGFMARVEIPYTPPEEYDLIAVVESDAPQECVTLGLLAGGSRFVAIIDGWGATQSVLALMENRAGDEGRHHGKVIVPGQPNVIVCAVRRTRLTITVNGQAIIDWQGDYSRLSLENVWSTPNPKALFIGAYQSVYRFTKLNVVPLTGEGRRLR